MKKYLVQIKRHDGEYSELKTKKEIIEMINFSDCTNEVYKIYDISNFGEIEELKICGPWHDASNPLYIKLTDKKDNLVFDCYGEEY